MTQEWIAPQSYNLRQITLLSVCCSTKGEYPSLLRRNMANLIGLSSFFFCSMKIQSHDVQSSQAFVDLVVTTVL